MGQKIIPLSLRLNKNENWHSKWVVNKNEFSDILHFDLEIRKYFEHIFNYRNLKLIELNIRKNSQNITIYAYIHENLQSKNLKFVHRITTYLNSYYKDHFIKIFIKKVKLKDLKLLKYNIAKIFFYIRKNNKIDYDMKKIIYSFSYAFYTKNITIISSQIQEMLERKKTHKKPIKKVNRVLEAFFKRFSNLVGYRLQFKGRLNGSKRKKKNVYQQGKIPLNTLKFDIKYHFNEFKTPSGVCSIKLWVFIKKKDNYVISKQNKI